MGPKLPLTLVELVDDEEVRDEVVDEITDEEDDDELVAVCVLLEVVVVVILLVVAVTALRVAKYAPPAMISMTTITITTNTAREIPPLFLIDLGFNLVRFFSWHRISLFKISYHMRASLNQVSHFFFGRETSSNWDRVF